MASQWTYGQQPSQAYGYNQYPQQYQQQPPQQYGHQQPQQYGQQQFSQYGQQQSQQYGQQPSQQHSQQQPQYYPQQQSPQYVPSQSQQYSQQQPQQYAQTFHQQPQPQYAQQPPLQQHPSPQGAQYPAQYPQAPDAAYPSQPQPGQQSCYNCGAAGHFAQDCPESRREVPAGAYNRPPPPKRQKPNPPVITKYAVPPHIQQNQGQPAQTYGPPYAQPSYPQFQGAQGPPTPMSSQSPSNQHWQQQQYGQQYPQTQPQYPQYSQPQQYSQPYQQGYQHPQQPYMPTAPATPATPQAQYQTSQASPQVAHQNTSSYFQNGHYSQQYVPQTQPMSHASPVSSVVQTVSDSQHHNSISTPTEVVAKSGTSRNSSVSMHSMSMTPKSQPAEIVEEANEDDLSMLDVPDIPVASLARPIPSNYIVADALDPFDAPQPEDNGHCQSKYTTQDASNTFEKIVKETRYWEEMKKDSIFVPPRNISRVISLDAIMSIYQPHHNEGERDQADIEEGEWTRDTRAGAGYTEGRDVRDVMDRLEHSLTAEKSARLPAKPPPTASWDHVQHGTSFKKNGRKHSVGDVAAHRGRAHHKDSLPHNKPHHSIEDTASSQGQVQHSNVYCENNRPLPPPPARESSSGCSPDRMSPLRSRTPSMYELNELDRQDNGGQGFIIDSISDGTPRIKPDEPGQCSSRDPFAPPPPPPPPLARLRKLSSFDGVNERPASADSSNGHVNGNGTEGAHHSKGNGRSYSHDHSTPPHATNGRKRDHDEQDLSAEDNTPKRRQVDDTASKLKKRQPRVAAAYR
ncbi:MAG: hypothetical protein LQ352_003013 [Teloschistes flavicans]|nr:MAG: hypothetical protein LQ352_003013 [Teloschistes flavicans]